MSDLDEYEDIVIDEAFARSKGCAMPELVNLLDDPDVLLHLKVSFFYWTFDVLLTFMIVRNECMLGNLFYRTDVLYLVESIGTDGFAFYNSPAVVS